MIHRFCVEVPMAIEQENLFVGSESIVQLQSLIYFLNIWSVDKISSGSKSNSSVLL